MIISKRASFPSVVFAAEFVAPIAQYASATGVLNDCSSDGFGTINFRGRALKWVVNPAGCLFQHLPLKIIKVSLLLFCIGPIAHAQSAFTISSAQAVAQSTNKPFEMTDNYTATKTCHQYPIFSIPHERGSNTDAFIITGRITNSVFCAASASNAFRAVLNATETSTTTNLNLKAVYGRVANETSRLLMTNQVEEFHNPQIESK